MFKYALYKNSQTPPIWAWLCSYHYLQEALGAQDAWRHLLRLSSPNTEFAIVKMADAFPAPVVLYDATVCKHRVHSLKDRDAVPALEHVEASANAYRVARHMES